MTRLTQIAVIPVAIYTPVKGLVIAETWDYILTSRRSDTAAWVA